MGAAGSCGGTVPSSPLFFFALKLRQYAVSELVVLGVRAWKTRLDFVPIEDDLKPLVLQSRAIASSCATTIGRPAFATNARPRSSRALSLGFEAVSALCR